MTRNGFLGLALVLVVAVPVLAGPYIPADLAPVPQIQLDVVVAEVNVEAEGLFGIAASKETERPGEKNHPALSIETERAEEVFKILKKLGQVNVHAAPKLMSLSGQLASCTIGGQQAIPVSAGLGQVGVQFITFGTRLTFLPIVRDDRIHIEVTMERRSPYDDRTTNKGIPPGRDTTCDTIGADVASGRSLVLLGEAISEKGKLIPNKRQIVLITPHVLSSDPVTGTPGMCSRQLDVSRNDLLVQVKAETRLTEKAPGSPLWPLKIETVAGRVQVRCPVFEASADRVEQDANRIVLEGKVQLLRKGEGDGPAIEMIAEKICLRFEAGRLQLRATGKE